MLVEVLVGAVVGLLVLVAVVGFAIRRSPQLFVAERLAERIHDDGGRVDEAGREPRDGGHDGFD